MTRFNYLAPARIPRFVVAATFAVDNRVRGPLGALAATLALTAGLTLVQLARLHDAQHAYALAEVRLTDADARAAALRAARGRLKGKARLVAYVADLRRGNAERANELAWIGNHLPADMWLRSLRYENGRYVLDGEAQRVVAVAAAMLRLRAAGGTSVPQLVSLHDDANVSGAHVRYSMRLSVCTTCASTHVAPEAGR